MAKKKLSSYHNGTELRLYKICALTPEKLQRILQVRERIIKNTGGRVFEDSTEVIRQIREERTRELMGESEDGL